MKVHMTWSVTVEGDERVTDLTEWADEVERGLLASEMIPDTARIKDVHETFGERPVVTLKWETDAESEVGENYKAS